MKHLGKIAVFIALIGLYTIWLSRAASAPEPTRAQEPLYTNDDPLTRQQRIWISALEWCESRGKETALNPKDLDGTPSLGAFQFKWATFKHYAIKYGLLDSNREDVDWQNLTWDRDIQLAIVERMINDPAVIWAREFPDCVTNKIGHPPK